MGRHLFMTLNMVGEDGFEPSKSSTTDLQSAPFGHSGTLPYLITATIIIICGETNVKEKFWSWWTDLNPRPADYKSAALPTELHQHIFLNDVLHRTMPQVNIILGNYQLVKYFFSSYFYFVHTTKMPANHTQASYTFIIKCAWDRQDIQPAQASRPLYIPQVR